MSGTRWLSDQEQRAWRAYLVSTRLLGAVLDREIQRGAGIPLAYFEIMVRLSEAPGGSLRMSDLADASESSRSRLSHAVARLEKSGWIRRESCPTDRRGAFAILTEAGRTALEDAAAVHVASVRKHLFDRLSPEQVEQLAAISNAVIDGLRDHEVSAGCPAAAGHDVAREDTLNVA